MRARKKEREKDERDTERNRAEGTEGPETAVFLVAQGLSLIFQCRESGSLGWGLRSHMSDIQETKT